MVLASQYGRAGLIHTQPKHEVYVWGGKPVRLAASRICVLYVDVDGAIGIRQEAWSAANAIAVNRIVCHETAGIAHGHRPGRVIWREPSRREAQYVVMLPIQLMTRVL